MSEFWIGGYKFINLSRPTATTLSRLDREVRPGVDSVTFWGTGVRSGPFPLLSVSDAVDASAGEAMFHLYEALVGAPVEMIWNGRASMVIVHDVQAVDDGIHQTLLGIGGVIGTSRGMVRAVWTLEYWPYVPEE